MYFVMGKPLGMLVLFHCPVWNVHRTATFSSHLFCAVVFASIQRSWVSRFISVVWTPFSTLIKPSLFITISQYHKGLYIFITIAYRLEVSNNAKFIKDREEQKRFFTAKTNGNWPTDWDVSSGGRVNLAGSDDTHHWFSATEANVFHESISHDWYGYYEIKA